MKTLKTSILALIIGASLGLPAAAQQKVADQPEASESALEFARRVNVCDGSEVLSAKYMDGRTSLHVRCSQGAGAGAELSGMSGGLGTGGALALGGGALIAIIALASGGSSSGSTTSTTGTN